MKVWQSTIYPLALLGSLMFLTGCSSYSFGDKQMDYRAAATQAPALDVPPDLGIPAIDDRYKMQLSDSETVATYSDYSKGGASRSALLPEVKGVSLERNSTQRYLLIKEKPEQVWPVIKAFLQESGLTILTEDPVAGLLETDWIENRAKIPQDFIRKFLGKVFENVYSSGERDQYRVRMERSKDGTSTEVYLTHKGMQEFLTADTNTSKWQTRPNDPEMEAIMLQRLMARLGGVQSAPANNTLSTGAATMKDNIMVLNDTFDRSWRRVGLALEHAEMAVEDKDRAKGIYFLSAAKPKQSWTDKLQFWKEISNQRYRVIVKDNGASSEVSVTNQDGVIDDNAKQLIDTLYKKIIQ
jgi:outer membrane protein assembly factor BamC